MTTATRHSAITADVDQLTRPIHVAVQGRVITHPCLLDQLREACTPTGCRTLGVTRSAPGSRPPLRLDLVSSLTEIYGGIATWHSRLGLPHPPCHQDWHKAVLRLLAEAAPTAAPALGDYLGDEVHDWWRMAATGSGWKPDQLYKLR